MFLPLKSSTNLLILNSPDSIKNPSPIAKFCCVLLVVIVAISCAPGALSGNFKLVSADHSAPVSALLTINNFPASPDLISGKPLGSSVHSAAVSPVFTIKALPASPDLISGIPGPSGPCGPIGP